MRRGDTVIVKEPSSVFIGMRGVIVSINPEQHWKVLVKLQDYTLKCHGHWFCSTELVVSK